MTRLILHLGDHKTGTSTLQRLFAGGHGPDHVLYPKAGRANGAGHHNLAWQCGDDVRFRPEKGSWCDVVSEIDAANAEITLISSEAFEFKRPAHVLAAVRAARSAKISAVDGLIYLRPHASRLLSSFAERVKRGIGPFDRAAFLDQALMGPRFQFMHRIDNWRRRLAPGKLDVRVFHPTCLRRGDIVADVFETVFETSPPAGLPEISNRSPDAISLQMMQMQGTALSAIGGPQATRSYAKSIEAAARSFGEGPKPKWTSAEAERIRRACLADARALDEMLCVDTFTRALDFAVDTADEHQQADDQLTSIMAQTAIAAARLSRAGHQGRLLHPQRRP